MTIIDDIENLFSQGELFVLTIIGNFQQAVTVVENDAKIAADWIVSHISDIDSTFKQVQSYVTTISYAAPIPEAVKTALNDANALVTGLNTYVADVKAGGATSAQAIVDGYLAAKQSQKAVATAAAAVVSGAIANPAVSPSS